MFPPVLFVGVLGLAAAGRGQTRWPEPLPDPRIAECAAVGAFGISDAASKDAMLVITLPPGASTAQVSGANHSAGAALIEIYEVP